MWYIYTIKYTARIRLWIRDSRLSINDALKILEGRRWLQDRNQSSWAKDEINILKLVGATDWFVKTPFLMEGAIQGVISGLLALGILFLVYGLFSMKKIYALGLPVLKLIFHRCRLRLSCPSRSFPNQLVFGN